MKNLEITIMLPLLILGLLPLMVIDLIRMVQGKPIVNEEWHDIHVDSNMNHGQGELAE